MAQRTGLPAALACRFLVAAFVVDGRHGRVEMAAHGRLHRVDVTLLDNDRIGADLKRHLTQAFGAERQERYWAIFEKLRLKLGYADYLGARP